MLTRKEILYAGTASLALHALAILMVITAFNFHSTRITMKSPPEFIVSLAGIPSNPPVQQTGGQAKNRGPAKAGKPEAKIADKKWQKRSKASPLPQEKAKIPGKTVNREFGIAVAATVSIQQAEGKKTALQATSAGQKGKEPGEAALSFSHSGNAPRSTDKAEGPNETSLLAASRYKDKPQPDYPQASRQRGEEGRVLITVEILENGSAGRLILKRSSGYQLLDQAALKAVRKCKFNPAVRNNVRIRSWGDVPIRFTLEDSD